MAKFEVFVGVMVGLTLLFYLTGLLEGTPNSVLMNFMLNPMGAQQDNLVIKILAIFSAVAAATIVVGFFSSGSPKQVAISGFTIFFMGLLWDFIAVVAKVYSVHQGIALLLFSPFLILYLISIISWWGYIT